MKKKTILVTGVAGFIGSNLLPKLLKNGHKVIGIDNLIKGSMNNIKEYLNNRNFKFIKTDILNTTSLNKIKGNIDCIVHLAAYKIPRYGNSHDTLKVNSIGTWNMLEVAKKHKSKFVFASTSEVYGMSQSIPFKEDDYLVMGKPSIMRWAYAVSKIYDEQLCYAFKDKYGIPFSIIRYFNSYGPKQHLSWWSNPISVFAEALKAGKTIEVHGDGRQKRAFCYIDDTVEGTVKVIESDKADNQVFNIGSTLEISINDLAKEIYRLYPAKKTFKIKHIPYNSICKGKEYEDVKRRIPDISKAKKLLGFAPKTKFIEGLKKTIEWHLSIK